jgi:hypothetical protein
MSASKTEGGPPIDELSAFETVTLAFDAAGGAKQTFNLSGALAGARQIFLLGVDAEGAGFTRRLRFKVHTSKVPLRVHYVAGLVNDDVSGFAVYLPTDGHLDFAVPRPLLADNAHLGTVTSLEISVSDWVGATASYTQLAVHLAVSRERFWDPHMDYTKMGPGAAAHHIRHQGFNQF